MTSSSSLPSSWREVTLGTFAPFTYGKGIRTAERIPSGGVPVIGSNGIIDYHDRPLTDGPTIVIGRKGTVGAVHYSPVPCWPIDTTFFITGDDPDLLKFKYYALKTLPLQDMNSDSAVPGLNRDEAHALPMSIPDEEEQRAIAHGLGTLDDKIELNRQMNETLESMARALFKSWFVDFEPVRAKIEGRWRQGESLPGLPAELFDIFPDRLTPSQLGEIPEGWEVKALGEVCEKPQYGYTASAKEGPVGPKFVRITDINKKNWMEWELVPHCEISDSDRAKYRLHEGDVLIARMADPGHGCMIEEDWEAVFASYLIRFRPTEDRLARFLQYWLRSDTYWELVEARGDGTTRISLNAKVLSGFPLALATSQVLDAFAEQISAIRSSVVANTAESRALAAQRDALLPRLLSGEVRV